MSIGRLYWLLLLTGMALRVAWGLMVPVVPVSDSWAYHTFAQTLAEHGTFGWTAAKPTAYWPVGTSAAVALTYRLVDGFAGVVILNLLAGLMILMLTHHLTRRWFGERAALCALAITAFWPNLIIFTSVLSSELFFMAMTLSGLYFWQRPGGRLLVNIVAAGLVWGLAAYVRPVILLVPVALTIVEFIRGPHAVFKAAIGAAATMLLMVAIAAPWALRNQGEFGAPVLISTNFGPNLWMGNNPESNGGYMRLPSETNAMSEVERNDYLAGKAKAFILEHPGEALKLLARKMVKLNERETIGVVWNANGLNPLVGERGIIVAKVIASGYWYMVLIGGWAGVIVIARRQSIFAAVFNPAFALWAYFTALHVVTVAEDRYHMPSSPFVVMLAAVALAALLKRRRALPRPVTPDLGFAA